MELPRPPWPLIEIAVEPRFGKTRAELVARLQGMADQDPFLIVAADEESGQIILGGNTERQLDGAFDALRREHGIEIAVGAPHVAYSETMTKRVEKDYTYKKQVFGDGQFARVKLVFEPVAGTIGTVFTAAVVGGAVPAAFVPGVGAGIASVARAGSLAGFPVMRVEATAPVDYHGALTGDLNARGRVESDEMRGHACVVTALVSLANLFGYESQLRSLTQGHGTHETSFDHYRPVPPRGGGWPPPAAAAALRA